MPTPLFTNVKVKFLEDNFSGCKTTYDSSLLGSGEVIIVAAPEDKTKGTDLVHCSNTTLTGEYMKRLLNFINRAVIRLLKERYDKKKQQKQLTEEYS